MSSVHAVGDLQCCVVATTSAKVFSVQHLTTIRVKLINAPESMALIGKVEVLLQLRKRWCILVSIEIAKQEHSITFVSSLTNEPQNVVCSGLRAANTTGDVRWERPMMINKQSNFTSAFVLQPSVHSRAYSIPLKMRILCDINITLGKLAPLIAPGNSNGLGGTVTGECASKSCYIQDMLHIITLLEAQEVEGVIFMTAVNEVASTVTVPTSYTKEVPPEEIVSENFDSQRLANFFWTSCSSGRPASYWSTSLTPKAGTK